jgi:flavorubredoxin
METRIDEIAPDIFRLSTYVPDVAPPAGFTFNQFVVRGEEPFLFHAGMRQLFPLVSAAVDQLVGLERLRWISFAHVEADECGAMNQFLAAAPDAQVIHGPLACMVSLNDLADRLPVIAGDDPLDIGGHRLRFLPTPHVPHNWESGLWFDETTRTLLAGDLFTSLGDGPALVETDHRPRRPRHDPLAGRAGAHDPGLHARLVVLRRRRCPAAIAGRPLRRRTHGLRSTAGSTPSP